MKKFETLEDYVEDLKKEKSGCYTCKHRRSVMGSAHSSCAHEIAKKLEFFLMLIAASGKGSVNPTGILLGNVPIQNWKEIGIVKNYVIFPINFDPVWLNYCLMFEEKES